MEPAVTSTAPELAKRQLDIGTMIHDWEAGQSFWADTVGLSYTKFEKIGGGVRQHRFDGNGSVIKVNHSRQPMDPHPTIHRRLRIVSDRVTEPRLVHDPEGVEVELVPAGHDDIIDVEIVNATANLGEARRFWVNGIGGTEIGPGRFRVGDSIVGCVEELDLTRPTNRRAPGFRYLTVQVQHVDEAWPRLVEMGFVGETPPVSLGETARVSFVRDPDGGYLEVSERAEFTGRPIPR
ncbi:MAG: VOC family protein [Actinomycetia bacterium]|nr:VOC family protein [Actinomycetes bacterium]MCP3910930.1 VOC family protein [Actinomycetes bacterium]MCP4087295.1 VOC family protein [Actinomycetes bacterium]